MWIAFVLWKIDICYNNKIRIKTSSLLWIAFVLWKIDICYNFSTFTMSRMDVVNCFCSLKDWYLLQPPFGKPSLTHCCELLLFFERLIFATNSLRCQMKSNRCELLLFFERLIFATTYNKKTNQEMRCELLLFFERLIFATTVWEIRKINLRLWIAFVLWKIDICYNLGCKRYVSKAVVNCFCSLKDWYLLQLQNTYQNRRLVVNCFCSLKDWYLLQLIR